jgi:hypothetical protein
MASGEDDVGRERGQFLRLILGACSRTVDCSEPGLLWPSARSALAASWTARRVSKAASAAAPTSWGERGPESQHSNKKFSREINGAASGLD